MFCNFLCGYFHRKQLDFNDVCNAQVLIANLQPKKLNKHEQHEKNMNFRDNIDSYLVDASKNNQILYWKLMTGILHTNSTTEIPPMHYTDNNGTVNFAFSVTDKIELLNTYFTSIFNLDDNNNEVPDLQPKCTDNFSNLVIQEHKVFDILSVIQVNKAVGSGSMSHKMLKSCKETSSKPLC